RAAPSAPRPGRAARLPPFLSRTFDASGGTMMRRNAAGLLALSMALFCGCAQYFIREIDYKEFHDRLQLPHDLPSNPALGAVPLSPVDPRAPADVDHPEREPRYLS